MNRKLKQTIGEIEKSGWIEILGACITLEARYNQLLVLFTRGLALESNAGEKIGLLFTAKTRS